MRDNTFVYLWRSIVDTSFYKNPLTCHLAIHLILSAAWKDHKIMVGGNEILIMRGQIPTGRNKLSDETGLSPQNIRTCLKHLKNSGFLTIKSTKELSIITICKYNNFQTHQQANQPTHQPSTNQASTKHQPLQNKGYKGNKEYSNDFLEFYSSYPLKKEKKKAYKRWQTLKKQNQLPPIDILLSAITKQKEWRKNNNGEFRPGWKHPATWLNAGCWEDEVEIKESDIKKQKSIQAGDMSIYDN